MKIWCYLLSILVRYLYNRPFCRKSINSKKFKLYRNPLKCLSHRQKWWVITGYNCLSIIHQLKIVFNGDKLESYYTVRLESFKIWQYRYTALDVFAQVWHSELKLLAESRGPPCAQSLYRCLGSQWDCFLTSNFFRHDQNAYHQMLNIRVEGKTWKYWFTNHGPSHSLGKSRVTARVGLPDVHNPLTPSRVFFRWCFWILMEKSRL